MQICVITLLKTDLPSQDLPSIRALSYAERSSFTLHNHFIQFYRELGTFHWIILPLDSMNTINTTNINKVLN